MFHVLYEEIQINNDPLQNLICLQTSDKQNVHVHVVHHRITILVMLLRWKHMEIEIYGNFKLFRDNHY